MKPFFYSCCIISVLAGITFYWVQGHASDPKTLPAERHPVQKDSATPETESIQSTENSPLANALHR